MSFHLFTSCEHYRNALTAFLYGELTEREGHSLRGHLACCGSCREEKARLEAVRHLFKKAGGGDEEPSPGLTRSLLQAAAEAVVEHPLVEPSRASRMPRWALVSLAAGVLVLVTTVSTPFLPGHIPSSRKVFVREEVGRAGPWILEKLTAYEIPATLSEKIAALASRPAVAEADGNAVSGAFDPSQTLTAEERTLLAGKVWDSSLLSFKVGRYEDALAGFSFLGSSFPEDPRALTSLKQAVMCCDQLGDKELAAAYRVRVQALESQQKQR